MSKPKPKLLTIFDSTAPDQPKSLHIGHKVMGLLVVGFFVVTWISSLGSPLLFWVAYRHEQHIVLAALSLCTVMAYLPWKRGTLCNLWQSLFNIPHYRLYRKFQILCEQELPPASPSHTFYAVHTHGAFCLGWSALVCSPFMESVQFCFAPALYWSPFFRLFSRCVGNPGSADKASMKKAMQRGQNLALPPGGFEEATLTDTTQDRVFIKRRTGFIKLCLQHGYRVRPVYCFGENKTFANIQGAWNFRLWLNRLGLPAILVWGTWYCPLLPRHDFDFLVLMGAPIELPQIANPTAAEVKKYHDQYIQALTNIYDTYKEQVYGTEKGSKDCKLQVW